MSCHEASAPILTTAPAQVHVLIPVRPTVHLSGAATLLYLARVITTPPGIPATGSPGPAVRDFVALNTSRFSRSPLYRHIETQPAGSILHPERDSSGTYQRLPKSEDLHTGLNVLYYSPSFWELSLVAHGEPHPCLTFVGSIQPGSRGSYPDVNSLHPNGKPLLVPQPYLGCTVSDPNNSLTCLVFCLLPLSFLH